MARIFSLVPWLLLLLGWEIAGHSHWLNPFVLPWPSLVLTAFLQQLASGALLLDAAWSLFRVFGGFLAAMLFGTALGIGTALSPRLRVILGPAIEFLRPIPPVAWVPLAIAWFGLGNGPAFFLTFVASFFPIFLSSAHGVESIALQHFQVAQCLQASPRLVFRRLVLPGALPQILAGYRIGFGMAWMAVVAAEMIAARSGLGHLIYVSQDVLRTDLVVAGMLTIGLLGILCDFVLKHVSRRLVPWGPK